MGLSGAVGPHTHCSAPTARQTWRNECVMAKYVETGTPRKTVGAYLKVVKALNELQALGEDVGFHYYLAALTGITGSIVQDDCTREWTFVQA